MLGPERLRREHEADPIAVAAAGPRFGWTIASGSTGVVQVGCRIRVALDERFASLAWDSGEVESGESVCATYGGPASIEWRVEGCEPAVDLLVPHNASARFVPPVEGVPALELGSGPRRLRYPWPAAGGLRPARGLLPGSVLWYHQRASLQGNGHHAS
jgi:hypothetical protein